MGYDLITSGYCSLDKIIKIKNTPEIGKTSIVANKNHCNIYYGGCNVNVAVNLSRLGYRAAPILRVGKDYVSSGFKEYLNINNINEDTIEYLEDEITSSTHLIETPNCDHITLFYPGAMDNKLISPYQDEWFKDSKCALMTVASLNDNQEFLRMVKKYNLPLFLGMKMDSDAFPKSFLKACLDNVEVLFTNESEAKCILDIYQVDTLVDLVDELPKIKTIVITLGKNGSKALTKLDNLVQVDEVEIVKVNKIVDTVGSGDAYIAGFIYGYLNNKDVEECMQYGSTLASFVIEGLGSTTNAPNQEEFLKRYLDHYGKEK